MRNCFFKLLVTLVLIFGFIVNASADNSFVGTSFDPAFSSFNPNRKTIMEWQRANISLFKDMFKKAPFKPLSARLDETNYVTLKQVPAGSFVFSLNADSVFSYLIDPYKYSGTWALKLPFSFYGINYITAGKLVAFILKYLKNHGRILSSKYNTELDLWKISFCTYSGFYSSIYLDGNKLAIGDKPSDKTGIDITFDSPAMPGADYQGFTPYAIKMKSLRK